MIVTCFCLACQDHFSFFQPNVISSSFYVACQDHFSFFQPNVISSSFYEACQDHFSFFQPNVISFSFYEACQDHFSFFQPNVISSIFCVTNHQQLTQYYQRHHQPMILLHVIQLHEEDHLLIMLQGEDLLLLFQELCEAS